MYMKYNFDGAYILKLHLKTIILRNSKLQFRVRNSSSSNFKYVEIKMRNDVQSGKSVPNHACQPATTKINEN